MSFVASFWITLQILHTKHLSSTWWECRHKCVSRIILQYPITLKTFAHLKLASKGMDIRRSGDKLKGCIIKMEFCASLDVGKDSASHLCCLKAFAFKVC